MSTLHVLQRMYRAAYMRRRRAEIAARGAIHRVALAHRAMLDAQGAIDAWYARQARKPAPLPVLPVPQG